MYGAFDVVLYFVNPTVLVANKLTSLSLSLKTMERSGCSLVDPLLPVAISTRVADRK